jgi:GT2 family glycosyltransferase
MADREPRRPSVTIVVVPRERFSIALRSLRSLLACTEPPYQLVYVDAGSPPAVRDALAAMASQHGFRLIRDDRPLSPTQARNLGRQAAEGEYVVFVDNDLLVTPGWLAALLACARETGAALVSPVILNGAPRNGVIHFAGGELEIAPGPAPRQARERHRLAGRRLAELEPGALARSGIDFGEFHCMLIRRAALDRLPPFDEGLLSMNEHLDVALELRGLGERLVVEPQARVVAYDRGPFTLADAAYAGLRWGPAWGEATHRRFAEKWGIDRSCRFFVDQDRFLAVQQRRVGLPLAPLRGAPDGPLAQTSIQLLNGLQAAGLPSDDLRLVRRACDIAAMLHGDTLRPSGKPFLAHLVGTAAVLARHGAPAAVVAAGLLHAAYSHGRFPRIAGDGRPRWRAWLRAELGAEVETILDHYFEVAFDGADGALPDAAVDALPLSAAFAAMVRVANEIDERLDQALGYGEKWTLPLPPVIGLFERVLGRLGAGAMVALLCRMAAEDGAPPVDPAMTMPVLSSYRHSPETGAPELVEIRHPRLARGLAGIADPLHGIPADAALIGIAVLEEGGPGDPGAVEDLARGNLGLLDGLLVAAHGEDDDAMLQRLRHEGLALAVLPADGRERAVDERLHDLLDLVRQVRAPAFVLPLAADELLQAADRGALLRALAAATSPGGAPAIARTPDGGGTEAGRRAVLSAALLGDELCRIVEEGGAIIDGGGGRVPLHPAPGIAVARLPQRAPRRASAEAAEAAALARELAATRAALVEVEAELAWRRRQVAAAEQEAADRSREAEALRASTSWRITAPLRALIGATRRR